MQVTIVSVNGDPVVHKAGCQHLQRGALRYAEVKVTLEVSNAQAAANDFWSDFVSSGEMTEAQALDYTAFAPCVDGLK